MERALEIDVAIDILNKIAEYHQAMARFLISSQKVLVDARQRREIVGQRMEQLERENRELRRQLGEFGGEN